MERAVSDCFARNASSCFANAGSFTAKLAITCKAAFAAPASPIANVASTYNIEATANGAERESDDELKRRVADYLLGLQSGNEASIKSACYSVEGITYVDVKENDPTNGNFTAYVAKLKAQTAGDLNRVLPALKDKAEIKDNRAQFNY